MCHVVLYVHDLRSSGVVRNAIAYAERIAQDNRVTLLAGHDDGLFRAEANGRGFALDTLAARSRPTAAWRLRRWLQAKKPAVLLSVGNLGHPSVYWATRGLRTARRVYRISSQTARGDGVRGVVRAGWMRMLARDASRIALVGAAHRDGVFARAIATGRAVEIANGVDRERARALAEAPSPHPWLDDTVPVVLAIARLRPQKNLGLLIEAVGLARQKRRLRLVILGEGMPAEREGLAAAAQAAGIVDDFLLAGETDNVFPWLARATMFALPSRWEGSSMALLEALAVETPVIAARGAGDAARVLADGRYGLLVDDDDAPALAEALLVQTSDTPVRPGGRARDYALSIDAYAALVDDVLKGRS